REDEGRNDVQQDDGDDGTVAAQLHGLADQGGGDAGVHQDAAEPGAPADVDQRGAPAFGRALVDVVQDGDEARAGIPAELQDLILRNEFGRGDQRAEQGQRRPDGGDDQEADHQVVALDAVVSQAKEAQNQDDTNHKFHDIPPFCSARPPSRRTVVIDGAYLLYTKTLSYATKNSCLVENLVIFANTEQKWRFRPQMAP